ncbi:serine hydrolase [Bacillus pseudomycoides]|uniref:serine hydrolase n=1 Tax=Bacillus pseudomycoides TaxID=64104 RepID=UPI000BEBA8E5|nr:serine hydrolase [Bacillus pseudomycoides]PDY46264.1 D-alanyl-D-alanine carboxypeptidase [Bacillus pseudomycoides]PEA84991.1 D-alanyl-D-alanine carboxypeptidase [Bacillus pseudomycoides]PED08744.1 D-alanyl-D-alanine carboxypeptidase [Bacillus pseudomycoides]PED73331.1 D-alanyl-D-alanine carboxypeptidase [Bacillus pseudomycoides]PEI44484.1 D-alanyl-D-alanine carboxypeptidase [Bacillus pseudomycoides]
MYMRKILSILLMFLLSFSSLGVTTSHAEEKIHIEAAAAILFDADTGKILHEQNPDELLAIASMSKLIVVYSVLEAIKEGKITWDTKVNISDYAYEISRNNEFSNVPFEKGRQYTVKELYHSIIIFSANGSSIALAELLAGSEKNFLNLANEHAKKLGLKKYKFVNATGLNNADLKGKHPEGTDPNGENSLSARDMGILSKTIITKYPEILEDTKQRFRNFPDNHPKPIRMENWNWMLPGAAFAYEGTDGLKTGSSDTAGYGFTISAKRGDLRLISVIIKTKSMDERFTESRELIDYGFNNFEKQKLKIDKNNTISVVKGKEDTVTVKPEKEITVITKKGSKPPYTISTEADKSLSQDGKVVAPIKKDAKVGSLVLESTDQYGFLDGNKKMKITAKTTEEVEKANWFILTMRSIGDFFSNIWSKLVG